jgi:hypothetical protein
LNSDRPGRLLMWLPEGFRIDCEMEESRYEKKGVKNPGHPIPRASPVQNPGFFWR